MEGLPDRLDRLDIIEHVDCIVGWLLVVKMSLLVLQ